MDAIQPGGARVRLCALLPGGDNKLRCWRPWNCHVSVDRTHSTPRIGAHHGYDTPINLSIFLRCMRIVYHVPWILGSWGRARVEYRSRHKAASKLQKLWRTRRQRRMEEAEKLRRIKVHEVRGAGGTLTWSWRTILPVRLMLSRSVHSNMIIPGGEKGSYISTPVTVRP